MSSELEQTEKNGEDNEIINETTYSLAYWRAIAALAGQKPDEIRMIGDVFVHFDETARGIPGAIQHHILERHAAEVNGGE